MTFGVAAPAGAAGIAAPFFALLVGAVAMGASPIFVRLGEVGPFAGAFWRVALALPPLYVWMRASERAGPQPTPFRRASVYSGLAFSGDLFFWHLAIFATTVADATLFATTAPFFVVLFGRLLWRTRVQGRTLAGLGLCALGALALLARSLSLGGAGAIGDLFGLATGAFFGAYFLTVQAARKHTGAARVTFEASVVTATILLVVALAWEPTFLPTTWKGAAALLALAWISHAGGQGLLSIALGRLPAVFSSLVIFLEALAAAGFGRLVLGEAVGAMQVLGGAFILAGIFVARPR